MSEKVLLEWEFVGKPFRLLLGFEADYIVEEYNPHLEEWVLAPGGALVLEDAALIQTLLARLNCPVANAKCQGKCSSSEWCKNLGDDAQEAHASKIKQLGDAFLAAALRLPQQVYKSDNGWVKIPPNYWQPFLEAKDAYEKATKET